MSKIISSDAICVKFLTPSLVIYGKGNELILRDEKIKLACNIRPYDKIHKISFLKHENDRFRIACAAGREILVTSENFKNSFLTKFNDWISSIKYLSDGSIAAITSHNFAILLKVEGEKLVIKEKLKCDDNSTLYCSHIDGDYWENLTFFAGTALGELIIWKRKTLFQKSLHNGVIFSIDYHHNFITTSSDDRSIKIYNASVDWDLTELKQFFGHTSRVFACKIIKYKNNFLFLSAGEDSNLCIWSCEDEGKLLTKKNIDSSGGIWSLDYNEKNETVVTSSSTGKLNLFRLNEIFYEVVQSFHHIQPTKLKFLSNGHLCILDYQMQIFIHNPVIDEWKKVMQLDVENQKVVAIESYKNRLFFMTRNSILIFDYDTTIDSLQFTSKLEIDYEKYSLQFDYFRAMHALNFHQVFISDASGICIVIDVNHHKLIKAFKIPKSAEPWSTAVAQIDRFWLIADRLGSLYLYKNNDVDNVESSCLEAIQKLKNLHGYKMGIKQIKYLKEDGFIKTTGSDGTIKTLFLNKEKEILEIYQFRRTMVKWIEKMENFYGKDFILGFNDNYFVISKSDGSEIIYEHSCGGRHRHWDLYSNNSLIKNRSNDDYKMRLAYIKRKQVNYVDFYLNDFTFPSTLNHQNENDFTWHTRPCNVIRMIDDVKILASGGEDTLIKLFKVNMMNDDISLKTIAEINSHISSVKAVTMWKCEENDDIWLISAGGRAQIVISRIIGMTHVKEEVNFMLTNSLALGNSRQATFDPETRFTSFHFDRESKFLFVGCSDGYLRVLKLIINIDSSASLRVMIESRYEKCILQVYAIRKDLVLTMSTDGIVCFWHFDDEALTIQIVDKLQHNRNGINSFDIINIEGNRYKIATAGDDCGVYITEFEHVVNENVIKYYETLHSYAGHIAQVTGTKFLSLNQLITVSIDQTICKWQLIENEELKVIDRKFTCVADVKGFSFYDNDNYIFIYGAGLEVVRKF